MRTRILTTLALALPLLAALAAREAAAQAVIQSRVDGADVVIDCVSGPCSGDLLRGERGDLAGGLPSYITGVTLPVTLPGEAALLGVEDGRYYQLANPSGVPISNMAFRQERHLDPQFMPDGTPYESIFLVSLPTLRSIDDLADTMSPLANKCVGDADGPAAGDGALNADDLLCAWWTSRASGSGSMLVSRRDPAVDSWQVRSAFFEPLSGRIEFSGTWTDPIEDAGEGYFVTVDGPPGTQNRFIIAGAEDPAFAGVPIATFRGAPTTYLLSFPYHGVADVAEGVLCDPLADIDANDDGRPDSCPGGIFDGDHALMVACRDSIIDGIPGGGDGAWISRAVRNSVFGYLFAGQSFPVRPGDGVLVMTSNAQIETLYLPLHY